MLANRILMAIKKLLIDRSVPVQVANVDYNIAGNGARKLVKMNDGTLICSTFNGYTQFYKSIDNGATWAKFWDKYIGDTTVSYAVAVYGTTVYLLRSRTTYYDVRLIKFDITSPDAFTEVLIDTQTAIGACSLAVDSTGALHAAWASKNGTYPNSFNIRYSKSTDGGATWAAPTQITTENLATSQCYNPCLVIRNNLPIVTISTDSYDGTKRIYCLYYSGSAWVVWKEVYNGAAYAQSNPNVFVDGNGALHVWWQGKDGVDTAKFNIRYSKSTDGGVTWSAAEKWTSGNTVDRQTPSGACDINGIPYVAYDDNGTLKWVKKDGAVSAPENIATGTNPSACANITDFTKPVTLFDGGVDVKFYGVWMA